MKNALLKFALQMPLIWMVLHGVADRVFGIPFASGMTAEQFIKVLIVGAILSAVYGFGEKLK